MLCNPIEAGEVKGLLADNDFFMQEKFDGKRILLQKEQQEVVGINRKGLTVGLPEPVVQAALQYDESFILDGECIGDVLHVFDLLRLDGVSLPTRTYGERHEMLQQLLRVVNDHLALVQTAGNQTQKSSLYLKLKGANKEGVVFKREDSFYLAGRPASGGPWLKCKFTATGSFIVSTINSQRSVGLEVFDGKDRVQVGNVTIPANKKVPKLGEIIEVRYLYAFKGGSVFQPVFLHVRDDLEAKDCVIGHLKYKADDTEEEN